MILTAKDTEVFTKFTKNQPITSVYFAPSLYLRGLIHLNYSGHCHSVSRLRLHSAIFFHCLTNRFFINLDFNLKIKLSLQNCAQVGFAGCVDWQAKPIDRGDAHCDGEYGKAIDRRQFRIDFDQNRCN